MLRRGLDALYLAAGWAAAACLMVVFAIMLVMAVGRQFAVNIPDGTYFAAWAMAAMSCLGLAHTFKQGEMIRVGLLLERLGGRTRLVAEALALTIAAAFLVYLSWQAWAFVATSRRLNDMSDGVLPVPLWLPQMALVAGLVILTIAVLDELVRVLGGRLPSFVKPPPATPEELLARVAEGGGV